MLLDAGTRFTGQVLLLAKVGSGLDLKGEVMTGELESLRAEVSRLNDLLHGEPKVRKFIYTAENGVEMEVQHWGVKAIAASVMDTFKTEGGPNFVTCTLDDGQRGPIEVTVRPLWGTKSTAQVLDELRKELAAAKAERDHLQRQLDEIWS